MEINSSLPILNDAQNHQKIPSEEYESVVRLFFHAQLSEIGRFPKERNFDHAETQ